MLKEWNIEPLFKEIEVDKENLHDKNLVINEIEEWGKYLQNDHMDIKEIKLKLDFLEKMMKEINDEPDFGDCKEKFNNFFDISVKKAQEYIEVVTAKINNEDWLIFEKDNQMLRVYTRHLLRVLELSPLLDNIELTQKCENLIFRIFSHSEYQDGDQIQKPAFYREYDGLYQGSMEEIYKVLSFQTVVRTSFEKKVYRIFRKQ